MAVRPARPARAALVALPDPALAGAVAQRLAADGLAASRTGPGTDPQAAVAAAAADAGGLAVLVVGVGTPPAGAFVGADPVAWSRSVHDALTPAFRLVRAAVPLLRQAGEGRVVVVGAGWEAARPGTTAAAAAHGAAVALVKTLARDLGPDGTTVNAVALPGWGDGPGAVDPAAVAEVVAYLASPAAGAVVGQVLGLGGAVQLRP